MVGAAGELGTAVDGLAAQGDLDVVLLVSGAAMAAASRAAVVGGEEDQGLVLGTGLIQSVHDGLKVVVVSFQLGVIFVRIIPVAVAHCVHIVGLHVDHGRVLVVLGVDIVRHVLHVAGVFGGTMQVYRRVGLNDTVDNRRPLGKGCVAPVGEGLAQRLKDGGVHRNLFAEGRGSNRAPASLLVI